jgi:hypothetical protein
LGNFEEEYLQKQREYVARAETKCSAMHFKYRRRIASTKALNTTKRMKPRISKHAGLFQYNLVLKRV